MALSAEVSDAKFPNEYIEMKFCERFNLTIFEYRQLPLQVVNLWSQMAKIEEGFNNSKQ
jgi:hypothetical protein